MCYRPALSAYGIQGKLVSVREHNEQQMADKIIAHLSDGLSVAQVSDVGTRGLRSRCETCRSRARSRI